MAIQLKIDQFMENILISLTCRGKIVGVSVAETALNIVNGFLAALVNFVCVFKAPQCGWHTKKVKGTRMRHDGSPSLSILSRPQARNP